jgi:FtsH-binding integral membrane protein
MDQGSVAEAQQTYLAKVYAWMVGGLLITSLTMVGVYTTGIYKSIITSPLFYVLIIGELGLVFGLSGAVHKMSSQVAALLFLGYSLLNGLTLSVIMIAYTQATIYTTFFIAAAMYGALSLFGYTTKKDLSGVGRFMFMGLIGIIIAMVINIFIGSSAIDFIVSVIGVIVFSGLTAYDTQKIKEEYTVMQQGEEIATKSAIIGALRLYLDFINLFLFLLRLLGGGRD